MSSDTSSGLPSAIDELVANWANNDLPPVELWHPSQARSIDMRIKKNGEWLYRGTPIRRPRLVQLFASVLRVEDDGSTWLVTPGEKLKIEVEDAHFQAVLLEVQHQHQQPALVFTTNVGERVTADATHLIDVQYASNDDTPNPYLRVRNGLIARISRAVFIDLAERAEIRDNVAGVVSCGVFMPLGPAQ